MPIVVVITLTRRHLPFNVLRTSYLGCWRAYGVPVVSSTMTWHCIVYFTHYDVPRYSSINSISRRSLVATELISFFYWYRMENEHGHGVRWVSTSKKNNVKNTHTRQNPVRGHRADSDNSGVEE